MKHKWSPIGWCLSCNLHRLTRFGRGGTFTRYYGWRDGKVVASSTAGVCDAWQGYPTAVADSPKVVTGHAWYNRDYG